MPTMPASTRPRWGLLTVAQREVTSLVSAEHRAKDQAGYLECAQKLAEEPGQKANWRGLQQN